MKKLSLLSGLLAGAVFAAVPQSVGFSARIVDEKSGALVSGEHQFTFTLFDATTGGTPRWSETRSLTLSDGVLLVELGETQPLSATLFSAGRLFLEVSYDGVTLEPRVSLASVPYALRADQAASAETLGGLGVDQLQRRVDSQCAAGSFATRVNADGSLTCAPSPAAGITSVTAANGLSGGGSSGNLSLGLMSCPANEVLKSNGASWACARDEVGRLEGVTSGSGLVGGGTTGTVSLGLMSCPADQLLKSTGTSWACASDLDTNAGLSSVSAMPGGGLMASGSSTAVALSLTTACSAGQLLKWDGGVWGCANDGVLGVSAGAGLSGGGQTGVVSLGLMSCPANQLLKSTGASWACASEATGDITAVTAGVGSGLTGGATSGDATLSLLTSCSAGQLLKWTGTVWVCAADLDTNSGGTVTSVSAAPGGGLTSTGSTSVALSLSTACAPNQLLKWNGAAWACANDVDTNSGGTLTSVTAGNGLTGGASSGAVQLDVTVGTGLVVSADAVSLDVAYTDARFVNASGDTMTGTLDMAQQRITNRGCPANYTRVGPGLCVEHTDQGALTFTACADRCRVAGTHLCRSAEMRSVLASGVALGSGLVLDWVDDQIGIGQALYVATTVAETMDGARATSTASFCRCCATVE
ncbi:MAG: hypothetical protein ABTQ32_23335 [Myxococcaceae bacterium]